MASAADAAALRAEIAGVAGELGLAAARPAGKAGAKAGGKGGKHAKGASSSRGVGRGASAVASGGARRRARAPSRDAAPAGDVAANAHDVETDASGRRWVRDARGKRIGVAPGARRERRGEEDAGGGKGGFAALKKGAGDGEGGFSGGGGGGRRRAGVAEEASLPWHAQLAALPALPQSASFAKAAEGRQPSSRAELEAASARALEAKEVGDKALEMAAKRFERDSGNAQDLRWLRKVRSSGTSADRVAAATLLVQQSPAANLAQLDALLGMVSGKGHRDTAAAVDALRELFATALLPDDRTLRPLAANDLEAALAELEAAKAKGVGAAERARERLALWRLEDALRSRYARLVAGLGELSTAQLPFLKERALRAAHALLLRKPEQERALLKLLVNKLGDPERKVASKAGYLLHGLLEEHPNMAHAVVLEVENFCFRPGISARAQYYAAVFLNQLVLTHRGDGPQVAARLVRLYFALFSRQLERAGSDAKERAEKAAKKTGEKARKARARGKRAPRRATENAKERAKEAAAPLEAAVDARVLTALLTGVNRAFPYVEEAEAEALIEEHSPTLFKLAHSASFGAVTQALALLYKLMEARSAVSDRFYRALYAALAAPALSSSVKAPLFLALLLRACAADVSHARTAAFAKRLLQVAAAARPEFTCGCLLVLSALLQKRPALWTAVLQSEVMEGDEEERFADEDDEDEEGDKGKKGGYDSDGSDGSGGDAKDPADAANAGADAGAPSGAVVPRGSAGEGGEAERDAGYDASKREPLFARAAGACAWELAALSRHVHPSVAAMARTLLAGAPISYSGDPIVDLSLAPFLDKWLHKAPRLQREGRRRFRGASLMQRVTGAGDGGGEGDEGAGGDKRRAFGGGVSAADGVEALAAAAPEDVLPSDRFFARFIQLKRGGQQQAAARKARVQAELEERQRREDGAEDGHDDFARDGSDDDSDDSDEDGDVAVGSDDSDDDDDDDGVAVGAESDDEDDYDVAEEEDVENDSEGGGDGGSDSEYDDDALRAAIEMDEDAIDAGEQGDGSDLSDVEDDSGADSDAAEGDSDGEEDSDSDGDEPWLFGGEDSSDGDGDGASSEDDASAEGAKGGKRARGSNPFASADDYMEAIEADEYIGKAKGGGKGGGKKGGKPAKRARR